MKTLFLIILLICATATVAKEPYQDAIFVGTESIADGSNCAGDVDQWGTVSAHCTPAYTTVYKIAMNGSLFFLKRSLDHPNVTMFTGYSVQGLGVMSAITPKGTQLSVQIDKEGRYAHVRIGKKESRYLILPGTTRIQ